MRRSYGNAGSHSPRGPRVPSCATHSSCAVPAGAAGSFGAWDDGPGTSGLLERYALQTLSVKVTLPPTSAAVTAKSEGQASLSEGGRVHMHHRIGCSCGRGLVS